MSVIHEAMVREYFEMLGYFVRQPRKDWIPGRPKNPEEEISMLVLHPGVEKHAPPETELWTSDDLKTVARAVIGVCGVHGVRCYASTLHNMTDLLRFASAESLEFASRILGTREIASILCVPRAPVSPQARRSLIAAARKYGVTGILTFETILTGLLRGVHPSRWYEKSDLLQALRLLKLYGLIRSPQMELFERRQRRAGRATSY